MSFVFTSHGVTEIIFNVFPSKQRKSIAQVHLKNALILLALIITFIIY